MLEERDYDFIRAFWERRPVVTYLFLAINILIFVLMELSGGTTNEATLLAWGVKSNLEIDQGQIWRLVTPVFIHIGLLHLFFNSYALWIVGAQVERLYGAERYVVLYVVTGIAGVLGSYWYHPAVISAGASGAIFGLFGVLLVFGLKHRSSIPPSFQRAVGTGVLPVIAINLIIGFTIPGIDNSAHVAGLLAGALLAAVIPFERPGGVSSPVFKFLQVALIVVVTGSFVQVFTHYDGPGISFRNLSPNVGSLTGSASSIGGFIETVNNAQQAFDQTMEALSEGKSEGLAEARKEAARSIGELKSIPSVAKEADELSAGLLVVMQDQAALLQDAERSQTVTFSQQDRGEENARRVKELMDRFSQWVDTEGRRYGIQLRKRQ